MGGAIINYILNNSMFTSYPIDQNWELQGLACAFTF